MQLPKKTLTFSEYLEQEQTSSTRCEYVSGHLFEISELNEEHNLISGNLNSRLDNHLKNKNCRLFISDMKLWIETANVCYYPDMMVACEPEDFQKDFQTRPCLIVEIVAPSTAGTDRREKKAAYQQVPSLKEYVLVDETQMKIEIYRKDERNFWNLETLWQDDEFDLESVGVKIPVAEVYEYVFNGEGIGEP